jgi:ERCC4-type nuclease
VHGDIPEVFPNKEFAYSKFSKPSVLGFMNTVRTSEKGFLLYLNQTKKCQEINLKTVNFNLFWDLDYVQKLVKIGKDFKLDKSPETEEEKAKRIQEFYKQPEKKELPEKEEIT